MQTALFRTMGLMRLPRSIRMVPIRTTMLRPRGRGTGATANPREHDPEKAWPGRDPGWIPVFGKGHAPAIGPRAMTMRRKVIPFEEPLRSGRDLCACVGLKTGALGAIPGLLQSSHRRGSTETYR